MTKYDEYWELRLGDQSKGTLLRNVLEALGFVYAGPNSFSGLSGLRHEFEAIGSNDRNILLVAGGAEKDRGVECELNPRQRMKEWRDQALLSALDVQNALLHEGLIVEIMFFHNVAYGYSLPFGEWAKRGISSTEAIQGWMADYKLPSDIELFCVLPRQEIEQLSNQELANVAQSVGASFLSLDDFAKEDLSTIVKAHANSDTDESIKIILKRSRLYQYFAPPTDELVLSAYDISRRKDRDLAKQIYDAARELGHPPAENILVPSADFNDPIETAKELEKHKYISFEHRVELTESGVRATQIIRKTAQGSSVIRALKALNLDKVVEAIIRATKGE
ncbi:MAG: hypothetical protein HY913_13955 [Desulfomonile tiedjei]|nr:hypothetical protein [Desulfomonile tiedjei]